MPSKLKSFHQLYVIAICLLSSQLLFSCQQQPANYEIAENFVAREITKDGHPSLLVGNIGFDKFTHKDEYPYFIKVISKYKFKGESMYPTSEEIYRLDSLENATQLMLKEEGIAEHYVFRETHKGLRTFYVVTNNKEQAEKAMSEFQKKEWLSPFDYTIVTDKKWQLFEASKKILSQQ